MGTTGLKTGLSDRDTHQEGRTQVGRMQPEGSGRLPGGGEVWVLLGVVSFPFRIMFSLKCVCIQHAFVF